MSALRMQAVSLAERAHALCAGIERLPASTQQSAISIQANQLALMLRAQETPETRDRWRLDLRVGFDRDDGPGVEHCEIAVEGSRQDIERLKARIGFWLRLEQQGLGERRRSPA